MWLSLVLSVTLIIRSNAVDEMKQHWIDKLDKALPDSPDLIVLPEALDRNDNVDKIQRLGYYDCRGTESMHHGGGTKWLINTSCIWGEKYEFKKKNNHNTMFNKSRTNQITYRTS